MSSKDGLTQEARIQFAIHDCLEIAEENGVLTEDDAMGVAEEWTTDSLDIESADDPQPDLDGIVSALNERFGF